MNKSRQRGDLAKFHQTADAAYSGDYKSFNQPKERNQDHNDLAHLSNIGVKPVSQVVVDEKGNVIRDSGDNNFTMNRLLQQHQHNYNLEDEAQTAYVVQKPQKMAVFRQYSQDGESIQELEETPQKRRCDELMGRVPNTTGVTCSS